mmetsp:Transcript_22804/g.36639  ORF Transcript_22804/g.36639 Transcript_22804/m.36639 type:complete len:465 (-) Transcript_22804:195-1589(-)|eukprot:CAMPEP_0202685228 /NCGR_PEP_ID=MMETSP1385-20130828/970_1 /ASSEMBLY_ACC=CAM_ASM_000861 /TAXON_ID=933848 /ORGANISM="Elphidium margaritaceum" /LENGTH=464 /DNA_ID=CAMNT_0049339539 /DNA_START=39 /DNA_END=1433 /DNA_ORIENTATION=+
MCACLDLANLPGDLLTQVLSSLSIKDLLQNATTCSAIHERSKFVLRKKLTNICLMIYDEQFTKPIKIQLDTRSRQTIIAISWKLCRGRPNIQAFLRTIWYGIEYVEYERYELHFVMQQLRIPFSALSNVKYVSCKYLYQCNLLKYVIKQSICQELQWINMPCFGRDKWEIIVGKCPKLRGLSFDHHVMFDDARTVHDPLIPLTPAPNLWTLSVFINDKIDLSIYCQIINEMIAAAPNLRYLCLRGHPSNTFNHSTSYAQQHLEHIMLPSNLIGLKLDYDCLMSLSFDFTNCPKCSFLDLQISFLTESVSTLGSYPYYAHLSQLLLSFLSNQTTERQKHLAIQLEFENGTNEVSVEEKFDAIQDFKAVLHDSEQNQRFDRQALKLYICRETHGDDAFEAYRLHEMWLTYLFEINPVCITTLFANDSPVSCRVFNKLMQEGMLQYDNETSQIVQFFRDMQNLQFIC